MSTDETFRDTFFNDRNLPKGAWLLSDSSVFYTWSYQAIVRCMGRWPDHDRASGEVCDPDSWKYYYDRASGDVEFYEDSLSPGAKVLCCRETDIFLRELVTSTPALEAEIRRRDDAERIPAEAARKAANERYEAKQDRERQRRQAMTPQEREREDTAAEARVMQAVRSAIRKPATQQHCACCCASRERPTALYPGQVDMAKHAEDMRAGRIPSPSTPSQPTQEAPARQGFGGYVPPIRTKFRKQ
jgi:hypothetical protein